MAQPASLVGIDVGHAVIRVVMTHRQDDGKLSVVGVGESSVEGFRKGHVFDSHALSQSITVAIEKAEKMAGEPVEQAFVSISSSLVTSMVSQGVVAVSRADGEIDHVDVERVLDAAASTCVPPNHEILLNSPLGFAVDHQRGIQDPVGMTGIRLEADTHVMYAQDQLTKQIVQSVLHTGVDVLDRIPSTYAACASAISAKQKELGCVLIDLASSSMNFAVYLDGALVHMYSHEIGCEYITNDISIGLKVDRDLAERLKLEYATCTSDEVNPRDVIDLSAFSPQETRLISRRELSEIVEARMSEMFEFVRKELNVLGYFGQLPGGMIFTGGGSKLPGVIDLARDSIGLPAQYGFPSEFLGLADKVDDPAYCGVVGLIIDGSSRNITRRGISMSFNPKEIVRSVSAWYHKLIQGHK